MTNAEHLERLLREKKYSEFREFCSIRCDANSPCKRKCSEAKGICEECDFYWLDRKHEEPMPELTTGMYCVLKDGFDFVYINGYKVWPDGSFGKYEDGDAKTIDKIYKPNSDHCGFNRLTDEYLIWKRED